MCCFVGYKAVLVNNTLTIDTIYPSVNISSITTTAGSQTISFNSTASDVNLLSCKYAIYNLTGSIDGLNNNVTVICNSSNSATVSTYNTFNLYVTSTDKAGNENTTNKTFIVSSSSSPSGGGGGSAPQKIAVVGLNQLDNKNYTELDREIIYARINDMCSSLFGQSIAQRDFSDTCVLGKTQINTILSTLVSNYSLILTQENLLQFYSNYKNRLFFQGFEIQAVITEKKLFSSIIGILAQLQISPPSIDSIFIISKDTAQYNLTSKLISNKELESCEVLSGNPYLTCQAMNNTIRVVYNVKDTQFFSKIFTGSILLKTKAESNKVETRQISLTFRVYNPFYEVIDGIPFYFLSLFIVGGASIGGYYAIHKYKRETKYLINKFDFSAS